MAHESTTDDSGSRSKGTVEITVENASLPDSEDDRNQMLDALGRRIGAVLQEDYDADAECVRAGVGPSYSHIRASCPACDSSLELISPQLDAENGASASARCTECQWSGVAQYRLIDLVGGFPDEEEMESAVAAGDATPCRTAYPRPKSNSEEGA